ncbi:hypothetical protein EGR_04956 [Echinococcus granulosus]|uniref:Uncharacterized protein n=1 Tax=Echinococcus granulosus TaxID=6210 RepID=W6UGW5_ECHGR|nr:hypothetical protein EGR_04956 [Echinococcus granulosus]EUB60246.1 hypothetical protein EGR_04956 [Echinococcus granulosus]
MSECLVCTIRPPRQTKGGTSRSQNLEKGERKASGVHWKSETQLKDGWSEDSLTFRRLFTGGLEQQRQRR